MELKYQAVVTCNGQNLQISPYFPNAADCREWLDQNEIKGECAIMPVLNWEECNRYNDQNGRKVWEVF